MLNDILILDQQWLPNQSDFPPISWPWYRAWPSPIMSGFRGAFATGAACQQGTLTLPDTWFRPPFWDLLMLQLLRPNSSNLPYLYSTFHLEYPLVLSRFCLVILRCQNYMMFPFSLLLLPPPSFRQCIALYAVAEGWLLIYIRLFFLLLEQDMTNISKINFCEYIQRGGLAK